MKKKILKFCKCIFALLLLSPLGNKHGPSLNKPESPSPRDVMCHVWLKLAHWFWRRKFFKFVNVFSLLCYYSSSKRLRSIIWTILNPLYPRMLCAKFGWIWLTGSGEDYWNLSMYFHYFLFIINYLPFEKDGDLHLNKHECPSPKILCAKFGWNWPTGSSEDFKILSMYFRYFFNYLPLGKCGVLHLNKFECPSPKNTLCQVWLKLVHWFWKSRFLKFVNVFS